jgi:hypothetical protein
MLSQTQLQGINETTTKLVEQSKSENNSGSNVTTTNTNDAQRSLFTPNPKNYSFEGRAIGASIGILLSLGYAFKTKSGFWKGMGYWLIGSIAVGGLGYGVGTLIKKKNKDVSTSEN